MEEEKRRNEEFKEMEEKIKIEYEIRLKEEQIKEQMEIEKEKELKEILKQKHIKPNKENLINKIKEKSDLNIYQENPSDERTIEQYLYDLEVENYVNFSNENFDGLVFLPSHIIIEKNDNFYLKAKKYFWIFYENGIFYLTKTHVLLTEYLPYPLNYLCFGLFGYLFALLFGISSKDGKKIFKKKNIKFFYII